LYTSDPSVKETAIRLSGEIVQEDDTLVNHLINLEPFGLEVLFGEEKKEYSIKLENISDQKIKAELVSFNHEYLEVKVPKKDIKPGKSRDIKLKFEKSNETERMGFNKSFTIELNDSLKTRYTIPVTYMKEKAAPRAARPGQKIPGATVSKPTGLKTKSGSNIEMIEVGTRKNK
jgi:Protein of unknown function (DUF1573)